MAVDTVECTRIPVEVNAGAKGNNSQLCVKAVSIVELNFDKRCKYSKVRAGMCIHVRTIHTSS